MKNNLFFYCFFLLTGVGLTVNAQHSVSVLRDLQENYLERSPIYDYNEQDLNNMDTIPGFNSKENRLKIFGIIYESDGITPAKDVILYIEQADERGNFDVRKENDKRYVHNRGWVKTNAQGQYTFYTYVPGNDRRYNQLQQLFPIIKEPLKPEYNITSLLFDEDPLLTKGCRKRMAKKGDPSRVLKPKNIDGLLTVQKDIILHEGIVVSK